MHVLGFLIVSMPDLCPLSYFHQNEQIISEDIDQGKAIKK